jgi:hypothetical protein
LKGKQKPQTIDFAEPTSRSSGKVTMHTNDTDKLTELSTDRPIWDRVFSVAPLVIVGSKEERGQFDLAPKHLADPGIGYRPAS